MDGIIIINKEKDYTSNDVVQIVKKVFKEKVGHTGTLDPMATGVLPLLVGKGTQCSKYLINHDKEYRAKIQLGIKTDTADITGKVIEERETENLEINSEKIKLVLNRFKGIIEQKPPMYSAIKIKGKKLYEYARKNQEIDVPTRKIEIYDLELLNYEKNQIEIKVKCSKGTYIRTLCEDIAKELGTIGTMSMLDRIKVGEFSIENSVTISEIKENINNSKFLKKYFIDIEKIFKQKERIVLDEKKLQHFLNGVKLSINKKDSEYRIYDIQEKFIGIGIIKEGRLKRDIITI